MTALGSLWRKWDLHIHTPASFQWKGAHFNKMNPGDKDAALKGIVDAMNATDVDVFGVMDYWTFDGYLAVKDYVAGNAGITTKTVLPGVELRMEAPTNHRLNTHVIFDDSVSADTLAQFLANLRIGGPQGRPPSRENFIALAKAYDDGKIRHHGFKPADKNDNDKMCLLGMQTAVITRESLLESLKIVGDQHYLIVQPYDTSDGLEELDWKRHPYTDSVLMKLAHVFEAKDPIHVSLFLGLGHPDKPNVGAEFLQCIGGRPKPVVRGSDAHAIADYGKYPNGRITWLKAQPTFNGLRQVCHEPAARCFIGALPPKLQHVKDNPTKYMKQLTIEKLVDGELDEIWFSGTSLELNPGLIAIIGNKGSGKSALADIIALAGNSHCSQMEFLNDSRFRHGTNKARHFQATLTWTDGTPVTVRLDGNPDSDLPERVRYLPQQFIENLCNEISAGNETNFEQELKKVIFFHVPEDKRLKKATLDELLEYRAQGSRKAILQLQNKISSFNQDISSIEREISEENLKSYRTALSLKQTELDAHDKTKPTPIDQPKDDPQNPQAKQKADALQAAHNEAERLKKAVEAAKVERSDLVTRDALLTRLTGHLDNFENSYTAFVDDNKEEFALAGLDLAEIVTVVIRRQPVDDLIKKTTDRLAELAALINGSEGIAGLESQAEEAAKKLAKLQAELDAPQRLYQAYLAELARWQSRRDEIVGAADKPETITFLKAKIENAEKVLPDQLENLKEQRRVRVREIHAELLKIRQTYQELYKPVQDIAATGDFVKDSLQLDFDAFLAPNSFEENFLDFIHRNRRGNFYGDDESRKYLRSLVSKRDFNKADDVIAFLDDIIKSLTTVDREGAAESLSIQSQLKQNKKVVELYDFLFSVRYLEPRYTLKLGGKDISQLSPGEKGALLLVFYLLLDREEIPIVVDQPEQNLDNESVVKLLVDCIRQVRSRRQVVIVTHNPNLAVVCDADQIIYSRIDKAAGNHITYDAGAIEDHPINEATVNVLEGTYPAFDNRRRKYHGPSDEILPAAPVAAAIPAEPVPAATVAD